MTKFKVGDYARYDKYLYEVIEIVETPNIKYKIRVIESLYKSSIGDEFFFNPPYLFENIYELDKFYNTKLYKVLL